MRVIMVDGTRRVYVFEDGQESSFDDVQKTAELRRKEPMTNVPHAKTVTVNAEMADKRRGRARKQ